MRRRQVEVGLDECTDRRDKDGAHACRALARGVLLRSVDMNLEQRNTYWPNLTETPWASIPCTPMGRETKTIMSQA